MTLSGAELRLSADVDGTGQTTGTFRLGANTRINSRTMTDYVVSRQFSGINAIVSDTLEGFDTERSGYYVDLGAGGKVIEVEKTGWTGSDERWGDGSGNSARDATGSSAWHQAQLLERFVTRGEYDSRNAGELAVGEISIDGEFEEAHLPVTVKEYEWTRQSDEPATFDINLTLARTAALDEALDIAKQVLF